MQCFTRHHRHPPSPPLAKGPIWWYMARIADRARRHKAQGPEQAPRHVHPAMPGSARRGSQGLDLGAGCCDGPHHRRPVRGFPYGRMRAGNPRRVRSAVRKAVTSATQPRR